jgi:hypothetical protein
VNNIKQNTSFPPRVLPQCSNYSIKGSAMLISPRPFIYLPFSQKIKNLHTKYCETQWTISKHEIHAHDLKHLFSSPSGRKVVYVSGQFFLRLPEPEKYFQFDSVFFSFCIIKHNYGSGTELTLLGWGFWKNLTLPLVLNC